MTNKAFRSIVFIILVIIASAFSSKFTIAGSETSGSAGCSGDKLPSVIKVLVLEFDPVIESYGSMKFHEVTGFNDPRQLASQYASDLKSVSGITYDIVEWDSPDEFPIMKDGFRYGDELADIILEAKAARGDWWNDSRLKNVDFCFDYDRYLTDTRFNIISKIKSGAIDEVWMFAGPVSGMYESAMAGKGAYWLNGAAFSNYDCRPFAIMGFNYERDAGCMLEDYGHRSECVLKTVFNFQGLDYGKPYEQLSLYEKFQAYDNVLPGKAGCGNVHWAPNSTSDYDWGNTAKAASDWQYFRDYPNGPDTRTDVDCSLWGNGDMRAHHLWWLGCFPHSEGRDNNGYLMNWWKYTTRLKTVKSVSVGTHSNNAYTELKDQSSLSIASGHSANLMLKSTYSDNSIDDNTADAAWASSNTAVATVQKGEVKCLSPGTATITGKIDGLGVSININVIPQTPPVSLEPSIRSLEVMQWDTKAISIYAVYKGGYKLDVTNIATYTPSKYIISTNRGVCTGMILGKGSLEIKYGNLKTVIPVQVKPSLHYWPIGDITDKYIGDWAAVSEDGASNKISKETSDIKAGFSDIRLDTKSGFDTALIYPKSKNANWNLSQYDTLECYIKSDNKNANAFQVASPEIRLCNESGYISYKSDTTYLNQSMEGWIKLTIDLKHDGDWYSEMVNHSSLTNIDWIEIHSDTWDYGYTLWVDGFMFKSDNPINNSITAPKPKVYVIDPFKSGSTRITGSTDAYYSVTAYVSNKVIGQATADKNGNFVINTRKQKSGTIVYVYATDLSGIKSEGVKLIVQKK